MRTVGAFLAALIAAGCLVVAAPGATGDEGELARARERANAAAAELSRAETRAGELELQVAEQQRQLEAAEASLASLRQTLRETAVSAYIGAAGDPAAQFISGEDLNRSVQAQALASLVTQNNADAVDQYRVVAEDAEAARAALDATLAEQRGVVESLRDRRRALDAELARLEELERQRREAEERRRAQEAAAAAAAARSRQRSTPAGNTVRSAPTGPIASGDWICPVQGAVAFVDSWGDPRSGGRRHQGVDMMAAHGTPVVAPVGGSVSHRGNSVGGMSFYLNGNDGNFYYGTHLSGYANPGSVAAGTVIGYVGDTGNAAGNPHLHFEIHPGGGAAINPYPTVRAHC
jgi:septal ring factor EnvC (AmiA/AmiB activator)